MPPARRALVPRPRRRCGGRVAKVADKKGFRGTFANIANFRGGRGAAPKVTGLSRFSVKVVNFVNFVMAGGAVRGRVFSSYGS